MPIAPADVAGWLNVAVPVGSQLVQLQLVCDAVEAHFAGHYRPDPDTGRLADVKLGLTMMAARLWKRQETPQGVTSGSDSFGPVYISRFDDDVDRLLPRQSGVA